MPMFLRLFFLFIIQVSSLIGFSDSVWAMFAAPSVTSTATIVSKSKINSDQVKITSRAIRPHAVLFSHWSADVSDLERNYHQFQISRGYIGFESEVSSFLKSRVTLDVAQLQQIAKAGRLSYGQAEYSNFNGTRLSVLKYAYIEISHPRKFPMTLRFGQTETPWHSVSDNYENARFIKPNIIEHLFMQASADLGLSVSLKLYKKIDIELGIFNGEGYHQTENNRYKDAITRISYLPFFKKHEALQCLSFTGYAQYGMVNTESVRHRLGSGIFYKYNKNRCDNPNDDLFATWVMYFVGKDGIDPVQTTRQGYNIGARFSFLWNIFIMGSYDAFDINSSGSNDSFTSHFAAIGYHLSPYFRFAFAYQNQQFENARDIAKEFYGLYFELKTPENQ